MNVSAPAPPAMVSSPAPPAMVSACELPVILNDPFVSAEPSQVNAFVPVNAAALSVNVSPDPTRASTVVTLVAASPSVTVSTFVTPSRSDVAEPLSVNRSSSVPAPPSIVSKELKCASRMIVSAPAPPAMVSAPAPETIISLPSPPKMESLFAV